MLVYHTINNIALIFIRSTKSMFLLSLNLFTLEVNLVTHSNEPLEESYHSERFRTVLTGQETWLPSLTVFGHSKFMKADLPLKPHYHNESIEFVIVSDGQQTYSTLTDDYLINSGEVFVSFPNELHGTGISHQFVGEIIWFQINLSHATNFLGLGEQWGYHLYSKLSAFNERKLKLSHTLIKEFIKSFNFITSSRLDDKLKGASLFVHCLTILIDNSYSIQSEVSSEILKAVDYITTNLTTLQTIDEIANHVNLSISRFKHKFKQDMGTPPREYINFCKTEKAKQLLTATTQSITDIAYSLNYTSSDYFSYTFKKYTGFTPLSFRKNAKDAQL